MSKENLERDRDNDDNDWINSGVISASCETHSSPARRTIGLAKGRIFSPSRTSTGTHPSPARRTIGLGGDKKFMHHAKT
ncbi:14985_t:CDS:2 [Acaulospora morrowiae]|uniref:14985_t:CDS:1 n=1 Tax=Acaulospora morrowiae TaxID=94023 RepID=A0A9N9DXR6_9GLOM|nr:14985_t:CDS:2 [Acaulospora morrowiae]